MAVAGVATLAALGAAQAPAASPRALETIVQDDALLLHRPADQVAATVQRLEALGADRIRITASWSSLAPQADSAQAPQFAADDPAAYDQARFAGLDTAVRAARAAGLRVLIDIGFWAPRWAADPTDGPRPRTNVDPRAFADFATAIARRYSGSFTPVVPDGAAPPPSADQSFLAQLFGGSPAPAPGPGPAAPLPEIDAVALWNEPNHPAFLTPTWSKAGSAWTPASPHAYRAMVAAAYPAVKAARPGLTVLVGNTASTGGSGGGSAVPPLAFLRSLACVDRALQPLDDARCADFARVPGDGWAHHPYALEGTPRRTATAKERDAVFTGDLGKLRSLIGRLAAAGRVAPGLRAIWLTEMGYETDDGAAVRGVSQAKQARYLPWSEYEAARVPGVRTFAQFLLRDVPPAATAQSDSTRRPLGQFGSGLERTDGTPKLSAAAFRAGLVAVRRPGGTVLLWTRLRGGDGPVSVRIERRLPGGRWARLQAFRAPGAGAVTRRARHVAGAHYRAVVPAWSITGTPTPAV